MRLQIAYNATDRVIKLGIVFLTSIVAARYFGRETYGIYAYINIVLSIGLALATSGIDTTIATKIAKDKEIEPSDLIIATSLKFFISLFASTMVYFHIKEKYPSETVALALSTATIILAGSVGYSETIMNALAKNKLMLTITITVIIPFSLAKFLTIIYFNSLTAKYTLDTLEILAIATTAYFILRNLIIKRNVASSIILKSKEFAKISFPLWLNGITLIIYSRYDQLFVGSIGTQGDIADYAIANQINTIAMVIPTSILVVAFPKMIQLRHTNRGHYETLLVKLYRGIGIYGIAWALFANLASEPLITAMFGSAYAGASAYLKILSIGIVFICIGQISGQWAIAEGHYWIALQRSLAGIVFMSVATQLLFNPYSTTMIAKISVINLFIVNIVMYFLLKGRREHFYIIQQSFLPRKNK